ncbi:hypothetical protein GUJ93_ZPchr0004g38658 [Zizania palustris]|uniref:Uncharacterized protein n=1 Tax=Zizania palustris TaxID=103762 RepID=A0A8J5S5I1_ZIZPA|nr:hypothetical protein GUJ93_ZPchr0004g38658 [Zizania palustris]
MALATTMKGKVIYEYFSKMKLLTNEMASAGKPLDDEQLVSYNPVVCLLALSSAWRCYKELHNSLSTECDVEGVTVVMTEGVATVAVVVLAMVGEEMANPSQHANSLARLVMLWPSAGNSLIHPS